MLRRISLKHRRLLNHCIRREFQHQSSPAEISLQNLSASSTENANNRHQSEEGPKKSFPSQEDLDVIKTNGNTDSFIPFFKEVDAHMLKTRHGDDVAPSASENTTWNRLSVNLLDNTDVPTGVRAPDEPSNPSLLLHDAETGQRRSILDAFPLRTTTSPSKSNVAFNEEAFSQYKTFMEEIDPKPAVVADWLFRNEKLIDYHLPRLEQVARSGETDPDDLAFRDEMEKQRFKFLAALPLTESEYRDATHCLIVVARLAAKRGTAIPVEIAWEKIKEAGMVLDKGSLSTIMHVSTTYGATIMTDNGIPSLMDLFRAAPETKLTNTESNEASGSADVTPSIELREEVAAFHDCLYEASEQSITVRVKGLVKKGNAEAALFVLAQSQDENLKLRTFQPIFKLCLERGDMSAAIALFHRMQSVPSVVLEAETFVQLIAALIQNGHISLNAPPIPGCRELGFDPPSGPGLLDQLVSMLAENVTEITPGLAKLLHTAMTSFLKDTEYSKSLRELHPLAPLLLDNEQASPDDALASRVSIDVTSGICPKSGARLRLINLAPNERLQLKNGLLNLAKTQSQEYAKRRWVRDVETSPDLKLEEFSNWLDARTGRPYTAIIDGANVAFNLQNFDAGKFNFHQIKFMVDTLDKMGETPLVILPNKYSRSSFFISKWNCKQSRQVMTSEERSILDNLHFSGKLYVTPRMVQDDHYWMLASISEQVSSRRGRSLEVSADDPQGRWPGARPVLISNDQMRDHKMNMIEPRLFRRWYSSHIVNFNFTGFVDSKQFDDEIVFSPADFFSREIQGNKTDQVITWHFPVKDWKDNERFCLRWPKA